MRIMLIAGMLLISVVGIGQSLTKDYPGSWREPRGDMMTNLSRALVKNNVRGCGEYYYKSYKEGGGQYLLACTADGKNWKLWEVWIPANKVHGPIKPSIATPY